MELPIHYQFTDSAAVRIGGYTFMIDTGCGKTIVDRGLLELVRHERVDDSPYELVTVSGDIVRLSDSVRVYLPVGGGRCLAVDALVADWTELRNNMARDYPGSDLHGLLGMDLLKRAKIDFPNRILVMNDISCDSDGESAVREVQGHNRG